MTAPGKTRLVACLVIAHDGRDHQYEPASEADEQTLLDHNEHSRTGWPGPARDLDLLGATRTAVAHCPTQFARTGTLLEDRSGAH